MAKLIIGRAPVTFPLTVQIPTPEGESEVTFTARHLRATAWAALREEQRAKVDKIVADLNAVNRKAAEKLYAERHPAAKGAKAAETVETEEMAVRKETEILNLMEPIKESELATLKAKVNGEMLAKIFSGWDLDDEISEASLADMCDLYPSAPVACYTKFNEALEGRRLGNLKPQPQASTSGQ